MIFPPVPDHFRLYLRAVGVLRSLRCPWPMPRSLWLLVIPSWENVVSYEIISHGTVFPVVRREWRRDLDEPKLTESALVNNIEPTIETATVDADSAQAKAWIEVLAQQSVPLNVAAPEGLDGTSFELGLGLREGIAGIDLRWWEEGPREWAGLTSKAKDVLRAMDKMRRRFTTVPTEAPPHAH